MNENGEKYCCSCDIFLGDLTGNMVDDFVVMQLKSRYDDVAEIYFCLKCFHEQAGQEYIDMLIEQRQQNIVKGKIKCTRCGVLFTPYKSTSRQCYYCEQKLMQTTKYGSIPPPQSLPISLDPLMYEIERDAKEYQRKQLQKAYEKMMRKK